jgi:UDP-3-O-[3-hydroxymyristoyl] N-acetylglucosamine deacetylase/3-hydroxyacyl-[acyl-carrier-protein] dehydratase
MTARTPERQQTVARPATVAGVSLMLGVPSTVTMRPAPADSGIVFVRTDLPERPEIRVEPTSKITDLSRCTGIRTAAVSLQTVEHVLSALAGLRIDNVVVEVSAPEPPIGDGSATPFVDALLAAGLVSQDAPRRYLEIPHPLSVEEADRQVVLLPAEDLRVTFVFDRYERTGVETQVATFDVTPEVYAREIAPARTFCFADEVDALRAAGLGKGADETNVVVIGDSGPVGTAYRFRDELARHKVLDLIGDLYLVGRPLRCHVLAVRSQHALNLQLVQRVFDMELEGSQRARHRLDPPLGPTDIERLLPHRYPFLLVDRVLELEEDTHIVALKNVTVNEEVFRGHFPGHPVMPGVLITEALAQAGGILVKRRPEYRDSLAYFATIDNAKFRRPVVPGDQLRLEVEVLRLRHRMGRLRGVAYVEGAVVAEAEFSFALVEAGAEPSASVSEP